jgi:hypothetical protein
MKTLTTTQNKTPKETQNREKKEENRRSNFNHAFLLISIEIIEKFDGKKSISCLIESVFQIVF